MINRLKIVAAALGLVVATGAVSEASAYTVARTVVTKKIVHVLPGHLHRARFIAPVRIVRPLPVRAAFVAPHRVVVGPRFVRVAHRPFMRPGLVHRPIAVIR
jgi:hypothetical protein